MDNENYSEIVAVPVPDVAVYSIGLGNEVAFYQVIVCARDIESAIKRALDVTHRTSDKVIEVKRLYNSAYIG